MKFDKATKILSVTVAELLEFQLDRVEKYQSEEYFCIVLQELQPGHYPTSSVDVINQFRKAAPSRFIARTPNSCLLDEHLKAKYAKAEHPRICLLKSLDPCYEFSFSMERP